ncbi:fibropellin-3-like [Chironomus tepperi]|uniref:fibropellin-3-like n=1 Tax=Chironomus tepperi TaxID=113505 RepID=UPI00391F7442
MNIGSIFIISVLLIQSIECKTVTNEEEVTVISNSSAMSTNIQECYQSSECPISEGCINKKCQNPCSLDVCGYKAECFVINHHPICKCGADYLGDPFNECIRKDGTTEPDERNYGLSPCGFFSSQYEATDGPVCACLPEFSGTPPNCTPQCRVHADCPADKVCFSFKCTNICETECRSADCKIVNHATICSCKEGYEGDAYAYKGCNARQDVNLD